MNKSPPQLGNLSHSPVSALHRFPANTSLVSMQLLDLHGVRDECGSHQQSAPGQLCPPHFARCGCGLGVLPGFLGSRYHCQEPVSVSSAPAPVSAAPGINKHSCKQVTNFFSRYLNMPCSFSSCLFGHIFGGYTAYLKVLGIGVKGEPAAQRPWISELFP